MDDKIKKIYVDCRFDIGIKRDDFIVAVGKTKSNSVYHVVESRKSERVSGFRFHLKVMLSDLLTCIKRGESQGLVSVTWNSRDKKKRP